MWTGFLDWSEMSAVLCVCSDAPLLFELCCPYAKWVSGRLESRFFWKPVHFRYYRCNSESMLPICFACRMSLNIYHI